MRHPFAVAAIVACVASTSMASAAQDTLPGDILYPVKVYINENVEQFFTFGKTAEAAWFAEKAERRFEEIETLIARGSLDEKRTSIVQAQLDKALKDAEHSSEPVTFGAILEAHAAILAKIDRDHALEPHVNPSIKETRQAVTKKHYTDNNIAIHADSDSEILLTPTLETVTEKQALAKRRIDMVSNALEDLDLDTETRVRVEAKIHAALDSYDKASLSLQYADYNDARDQFIDSMMYAQEAKLITFAPKFLGFEDVVNISSSSKHTMNESDVMDDKNTTPEKKNAKEQKKDSTHDTQDNDEDSEDPESPSSNDGEEDEENEEEMIESVLKDTQKKADKAEDTIKETVRTLVP